MLLKEILEKLECPTDLFLRNFCHVEDLAETTGVMVATAGNEDAACDDGKLWLGLELSGLFSVLEDVLGAIGDTLREMVAVAESADLLEGLKQQFVTLIGGYLALSAVQILAAHGAIAKGNAGL